MRHRQHFITAVFLTIFVSALVGASAGLHTRSEKLNVNDDLRILNNGWDTGQFLVYHEHIFRPVSYAVGLKLLSDDFQTQYGRMPSDFVLKTNYGHLWIEDTDIGLQWKAITPSGQALHFDILKAIREAGADPSEDRRWVGRAEDLKAYIPTRMLGANYVFPEQRLYLSSSQNGGTWIPDPTEPGDPSLINQYYRTNWLPDPADREVWEIVQAKSLVEVVVTKGLVIKLNPNRNSGKTTSSACDKAVLGSFAAEFPKLLTNPRNEHDATKHLYRNRKARAFTIAETDEFTTLNETGVKTWTGRDPIEPPFKKVEQVPFQVNSQIWGSGSNEPFAPENGRKFKSFDRVFYLPVGQTIPKAERVRFLEDKLTSKRELDLRLSYLIDKHMPSAIATEITKTPNMRKAEAYARLVHESVDFFLDACCIIGVSEKFTQVQRMTCERVQSCYAYFVRAVGTKLLRELRFDRDDDGKPKSDSELITVFNMADPLEFKRIVDKRIGPANDSNRISSGRSWPNLVVKFPMIYFAQNEPAMQAIGSCDEFFQILDRIQTEEDAVKSIDEYQVVIDSVHLGLLPKQENHQFQGLTWEQAAIFTLWSRYIEQPT